MEISILSRVKSYKISFFNFLLTNKYKNLLNTIIKIFFIKYFLSYKTSNNFIKNICNLIANYIIFFFKLFFFFNLLSIFLILTDYFHYFMPKSVQVRSLNSKYLTKYFILYFYIIVCIKLRNHFIYTGWTKSLHTVEYLI